MKVKHHNKCHTAWPWLLGHVKHVKHVKAEYGDVPTSLWKCDLLIWVFPKIGVPQNGWFIMVNPIKMDDLGVHLFLEIPIYCKCCVFLNIISEAG